MTKVYVVTSGSYSSYHIIGVFSTRYKARKVVQWQEDLDSYGDYRVETYILDRGFEPEKRGLKPWLVRMNREGHVEHADFSDWAESLACFYLEGRKGHRWLSGHVWAKSQEHAVKIVNERRTQMIAEGKWEG